MRALEIPKQEELASHSPELRRRRLGRRQTAKEVGILGPEAPLEEEDHLIREAIRRLQRSSEVIRGHQAGLESLEEEDHLRHQEALRGHSESTQGALRGRSEGAQRALRGRSAGAQRALK